MIQRRLSLPGHPGGFLWPVVVATVSRLYREVAATRGSARGRRHILRQRDRSKNGLTSLRLIGRSIVEVRESQHLPGFGVAILGLLLAGFGFAGRAIAAAPSFSNVFIVVEENRRYSDVVGSPLMPYLNMLINNYGLATEYYANQHHSLPNYLWLTSGDNDGVTIDSCFPVIWKDNVIQELTEAGVSWKAYEQGLPSDGYVGCTAGEYRKRHDPFAYYDIVLDDASQLHNIVPAAQLLTDVATTKFSRYNFIVPDLCHDMHADLSCSNGCTSWSSSACWTEADKWLQSNLEPLLNTAMFQPGGSGLLIITFDESVNTDTANGGGHVAWVAVSPLAKPGYKSTTVYQHQSTLRLMLEGLGVTGLPNGAATAPDMNEFFN